MINNLNNLINQYGTPDALIDNWDEGLIGYAVWGFEESIIWNNQGLYISNKKVKPDLGLIQESINNWKKQSNDIACLSFISYNFKNILYPHIKFQNYNENFPYLLFIKPRLIKKYKIEKNSGQNVSLKMIKDFMNYQEYKVKLDKIKNELHDGNVYQINFTNNKKYKSMNEAFDIYLSLRSQIKPKYGFYFNYEQYKILSFSPELFFKCKSNYIESHPMKGTINRSNNLKIDNDLKLKLKNSEKDKAEHLMIVDLMRNDIGKIAENESVKVDQLYEVKSYKTVHQMISKVKGKVKQSIQEIDIIKALFPGGSVTGAPKESAMKIIDSLENYSRDIYTGSLGYIKSNGDMKFNIAIRTLCFDNDIASYGIGGGIVWDSESKSEWLEAHLKSKILSSILN
tara:strand:+ start:86 stop:1279 length:1194 start_codon:yes stop_codon:yes gene_type:complete